LLKATSKKWQHNNSNPKNILRKTTNSLKSV